MTEGHPTPQEQLRQSVRAELGVVARDAVLTLTNIGIPVPGLVPAADLDAMRRQRDALVAVLNEMLRTAGTPEWSEALRKAAVACRLDAPGLHIPDPLAAAVDLLDRCRRGGTWMPMFRMGVEHAIDHLQDVMAGRSGEHSDMARDEAADRDG